MKTLARILLVEDNPHDEELTLEAFAECRLANEVAVVRDGQQALDYLLHQGDYKDRQCGNPAVILLDLKLPKINGMEVLRRLKEDPELKTIPVVIMTSSREERDVAEGYQLGVKPMWSSRLSSPASSRRSRISACSGHSSTIRRSAA